MPSKTKRGSLREIRRAEKPKANAWDSCIATGRTHTTSTYAHGHSGYDSCCPFGIVEGAGVPAFPPSLARTVSPLCQSPPAYSSSPGTVMVVPRAASRLRTRVTTPMMTTADTRRKLDAAVTMGVVP